MKSKRTPKPCSTMCLGMMSMTEHIKNLEAERQNLKVVNRELMDALETLMRNKCPSVFKLIKR